MIVENDRTPTEVHGSRTEAYFSVKQENLAHIFGILRNNLYSDKPRAILREYTTNAIDAHVDAGVDVPVQITPPTFLSPNLTIRDFGAGLSEDDVFNVWASYGESTKRSSNTQVGMMGLGSKSAFSYTDSFSILSHHNGICKTYNAFIDDTGIGMVVKIDEKDTEESGIEIQIPVNTSDIWSFERAIISVVKYMENVVVNSKHLQQELADAKPNFFVTGEGWALGKGSENLNVIMGGVCYNVSLHDLQKYHQDISKFRHYNTSITFFANIGDVVPSASRETLNLNEKTLSFIIAKFDQMRDEMKSTFQKTIEDAENPWTARLLWKKAPQQIKALFDNDLTNSGIEICKTISVEKLDGILMRRRFDGKDWKVTQSLSPLSSTVLYVGKGNVSRNSIMQRIQNSNNDVNEDDYVLNFENQHFADEFLKLVEGAKIVDLGELPYYHRRASRPQGMAIKADMWRYLDTNHETPRSAWEAIQGDLEDGEGIYIPIKHHQPILGTLQGLSNKLNAFYYVIGERIKLIGIREADVKKLGSGWTDLEEYMKSTLATKRDEISETLFDKFLYQALPEYVKGAIDAYGKTDRSCPIDVNGINSYARNQGYSYSGFDFLVRHNLAQPFDDIDQQVQDIKARFDKYPMLQTVDWIRCNLQIVEDYIAMIDMGG